MLRFCNRFSLLTLFMLCIHAGQAQNYWVSTTGSNQAAGTSSAPFKSITHAKNVALNSGFTTLNIYVYPGTYYENVRIQSIPGNVELTFQSTSGDPTNTILDGGGSGPVMEASAADFTMKGFTLTNGEGKFLSTLTWALYPPLATTALPNVPIGDYGGGVLCYNQSYPIFENCIITGNHSDDFGGGVAVVNPPPATLAVQFKNCTIVDNVADKQGGGMYIRYSRGSLDECFVTGNTGTNNGGGISVNYGGDLSCYNSVISGNTTDNPNSTGKGGAIFSVEATKTLYFTTVADNFSDIDGAVWLGSNSHMYGVNSIFWGNYPAELHWAGSGSSIGSSTMTLCDIQGGYTTNGTNKVGLHNFSADPLFSVPLPLAGIPDVNQLGDYHIDPPQGGGMGGGTALVSPCVSLVTSFSLTMDIEGSPRPSPASLSDLADIGAYESLDCRPHDASLSTIRVQANGYKECDADGSTDWPYLHIQDAIDNAKSGDVIQVGPGTFPGSVDYKGKDITIQSDGYDPLWFVTSTIQNYKITGGGLSGPTVIMDNAQAELLGFTVSQGVSGIELSADALVKHCIIESHQGSVNGGGVIVASGQSPTLDGVIIRNNEADYGAGLYLQGWPSLTDVEIIDNHALYDGGGFYLNGITMSSPITYAPVLDGNSAARNGGGVYIKDCDLEWETTDFEENEAAANGGAMYIENSDVKLSQCSFENNEVDENGGGLATSGSNVILDRCTLSYNEALAYGGALAADAGELEIDQCLFTFNIAEDGAGIYFLDGTNTHLITDSELRLNMASGAGGAIYASNSGVSFQETLIWLNDAADDGGGIYANLGAALKIDACEFNQNTSTGGRGGAIYMDQSVMQTTSTQQGLATEFKHNSASSHGGGIYIHHAQGSVTMDNTIMYDNEATGGDGGAIYSALSSVDFTGDVTGVDEFEDNSALNGGAVYMYYGTFTVQQSTFESNSCTSDGGAIVIEGQALNAEAISIYHSSASRGGALMLAQAYLVDLENCLIQSNTATQGGAVFSDQSQIQTDQVSMLSNTGSTDGGAIHLSNSSGLNMDHTTLAGNFGGLGGALRIDDSEVILENCLISGNDASQGGVLYASADALIKAEHVTMSRNDDNALRGIYLSDGVQMDLINSIYWPHLGSTSKIFLDPNTAVNACTLEVRYSDVQNGQAAVDYSQSHGVLEWGANNQNNNPDFINPELSATLPNALGDFRLDDYSPCLSTGMDQVVTTWTQVTYDSPDDDRDLNPRAAPSYSYPDMGAYEHGDGFYGPEAVFEGLKYNDLNNNGQRDPGEPGIEGWTIYYYLPNGQRVKLVTDADGRFLVVGLPNGHYEINEVIPLVSFGYWTQTQGGHEVLLESGSQNIFNNLLFGNHWQLEETGPDNPGWVTVHEGDFKDLPRSLEQLQDPNAYAVSFELSYDPLHLLPTGSVQGGGLDYELDISTPGMVYVTAYDDLPINSQTVVNTEFKALAATSQTTVYQSFDGDAPDMELLHFNIEEPLSFPIIPNPSNGIFQIDLTEITGVTNIEVIEVQNGNTVFLDTSFPGGGFFSIDISGGNIGVYDVIVTTGSTTIVEQALVQ